MRRRMAGTVHFCPARRSVGSPRASVPLMGMVVPPSLSRHSSRHSHQRIAAYQRVFWSSWCWQSHIGAVSRRRRTSDQVPCRRPRNLRPSLEGHRKIKHPTRSTNMPPVLQPEPLLHPVRAHRPLPHAVHVSVGRFQRHFVPPPFGRLLSRPWRSHVHQTSNNSPLVGPRHGRMKGASVGRP
jgi:hypothetical protein